MRVSFPIPAVILAAAAGTAALVAQVPDAPAPGAPSPAPTTSGTPASGSSNARSSPKSSGPSFLGRDVPSFDPGTEVLSWDGKNWNVNNNRIFQARFEKYLNAPEETSTEDRQYQTIIAQVLQLLAPGNATRENVDTAFRLLARGSNFDIDARLCDALADAVYTVWAAQRQQQRLAMANETLEQERKKHEWNAKLAGERGSFEKTVTNSRKSGDSTNTTATKEVLTLTPYLTRLAETTARIKANEVKRELSEIQAKVEYQALIVQLFLQRRFQHVLMATRFYRAIFSDGDSKLNLGNDTKELFVRSAGMAPTVSTLDSMANEAVRDVREGIRAFEYLLANDELESATKRLAEAFTIGEYITDLRTLPRTRKRRALEFTQKTNQLISALDVRDYGLAEKLVKEIRTLAKDFDWSKPSGLIEAKKVEARFRVAAARNAALSGDRQTLEKELAAAAEVWPQNPELADISQKIFEQGDVQQKAIVDFDQLMSQKNFRQIFDNSARYLAATVLYPDRKTQLEEVLQNMRTIETAILRADEMRKQSNYAGAWESVETVAPQFPNDTKLNQVRADLTTQAADFVRTVRGAEDLEKRDQIGGSLAWYLKAQKIYPASEFARAGIERLKKKILPAD